MESFAFVRNQKLKSKPKDQSKLGFGSIVTDYMFRMDYDPEQGWHGGRIMPYGPIQLAPSAMVLHYAQEVFEGLKAFRAADGQINIFRPMENIRRMNRSCERVCIPPIPEETALEAIKAIVKREAGWIPTAPGTSLYIRPFIIATQPGLGVRNAETYSFFIIVSPSGYYYSKGLSPTKILIEDEDVRATAGGTGYAKLGANYAISLRAGAKAAAMGFDQVLWLDGAEKKYIEEIGSANAFFVIDGTVVTCPLTGTILPGITRKSVIQLLAERDFPVEERKLAVDELLELLSAGHVSEVFASGTSVGISPVGMLGYRGKEYIVNRNEAGPVSQMLNNTITGIQRGEIVDEFGWIEKIET